MIYLAICFILLNLTLEEPKQAYGQVKSRYKRYVVFPEGSTFSVAFCNTWKTLTGDKDIYTLGLNWAVSYELPNTTLRDPDTRRPYLRRRHRREVYRRLEVAMESAGLDGRSCILRAICEATHYMQPRVGLFYEMLRLIFTIPEESHGVEMEAEEFEMYQRAQSKGTLQNNCLDLYPSCPFSLPDLLLGDMDY